VFEGQSIGAPGLSVGEVVFNTAMTGYQEILTDPSYARQLVTLTSPHIGNTGINSDDGEGDRVWAAGLIVRDVPRRPSSWRSRQALPQWLHKQGVVAMSGLDTRKLTRLLRTHGSQNGALMAGEVDVDAALAAVRTFTGLKGMDLAREVTTSTAYTWNQGGFDLERTAFINTKSKYNVVVYDFGVKANILRLLAERGCCLTVVPAQTPAHEVLAMKPDGVFLSNGPGDPEPCGYAIAAIRTFLTHHIPLFGICLGHQLLGLAAGAHTMKMNHGHHGANHPVQELASGQVLITSQNHGFALNEASLPDTVRITHRSLFDHTIQGIELTDALAFSFQGHPEAAPGPHDVSALFDRFASMLEAVKTGKPNNASLQAVMKDDGMEQRA